MPRGTKRPRAQSAKKLVTNYKATVVKSRKHARVVTSQFHDLQRKMERAKRAKHAGKDASAEISSLEKEFQALGGRAAYQEASAVSTAHFNSSKYVYSVLTHLGLRPGKGQPALPLLEIGAINTSLLRCKWLATTAIDLRANAPGIQKQDFLTLPVPHTGGAFQAIVCSMVLNCVTDAADRGRMLLHAWQHLRRHGILLVGLPKRCLLASAFCDTGTWLAAVRAAGFQLVHCRQTPKLLFFALRRLDAPDPAGSASADQARPGVSAWLTGGPHALTEPPLLSPTCVFQRSDLVRDAPPAPPSAVQAAGEAAPGVDMQDWPLWLVQGVQEAAHLLAAPTEKLLGRVRSPQKCLHPRLLPAKGGDKAEFGVALEVQWAPTGAGEAAYAK